MTRARGENTASNAEIALRALRGRACPISVPDWQLRLARPLCERGKRGGFRATPGPFSPPFRRDCLERSKGLYACRCKTRSASRRGPGFGSCTRCVARGLCDLLAFRAGVAVVLGESLPLASPHCQGRPTGVILETPIYPNSWFVVSLDSGEETKCRISSIELEVRISEETTCRELGSTTRWPRRRRCCRVRPRRAMRRQPRQQLRAEAQRPRGARLQGLRHPRRRRRPRPPRTPRRCCSLPSSPCAGTASA